MKARGARRLRVGALFLACIACNSQFRFDDAGAAADPACAVDADCALQTLRCDPVSHDCVACLNDNDCVTGGMGKRCDAALHVCVSCGSDLDCGDAGACEPTSRTCVPLCSEHKEKDCPPTAPTCDEIRGFCVRCRTNDDCANETDDGKLCDMATGRCVHCLVDATCGPDAPRCDPSRGRCVACMTSDDCPSGSCEPFSQTCVR